MSKEKILEAFCEKHSTFLHLQNDNNVIDGDATAVFEAMDEYSKEQVIKAIQFFRNDNIANGLFNYKILKADNQVATSEDLYNLFIRSGAKVV